MTIILISGKQGSGKTTLQKSLTEALFRKHDLGATIVNFADIIYEMHDAVLEILHKYYPKRDLAKDGPLLQVLGTEWGRKTLGEQVWIECLWAKLKRTSEVGNWTEREQYVIIGDCRFENEFDAFPEALRIRLDCPESIRKERCSMWRTKTDHPSEIGLDKYAKEGKFDLNVSTAGDFPEAGLLSLVMVALEKHSWIERRRK